MPVQIGGTYSVRVGGTHGANPRSNPSQTARVEGTHGASLRLNPSQMAIVSLPPTIGNPLRTSGALTADQFPVKTSGTRAAVILNIGSLTTVSGRREVGRPMKNIGWRTKRSSSPRCIRVSRTNRCRSPPLLCHAGHTFHRIVHTKQVQIQPLPY